MNTFALPQFRKVTLLSVLIAFASAVLDGCVSIGVIMKPGPAGTPLPGFGTFEGRIYETASDAEKDVGSLRTVDWKLFFARQSNGMPFREGAGNVWAATELSPGDYRLVVSWGNHPEKTKSPSAGSGVDTFSLKAGETAQARVIVKKPPAGWLVPLGVLAVAAYAVAPTGRSVPLGTGTPGVHSPSQTVVRTHGQRRAQPGDLTTKNERD